MGSLGLLCRCAAAALLAAAHPVAAQGVRAWDAPIAEASARFGVPASWIRRVMQVESAGQALRRGRPIRSRVGAMGLMQLMPGTWHAMRRAHGLGPDPDDPRDNILAGTAYLRAMYDRFGYPGLFAAYNAGPARYSAYLARGRRLPNETVDYLVRLGIPARSGPPGLLAPAPNPGAAASASLAGAILLRPDPGDEPPSVFFRLGGPPAH